MSNKVKLQYGSWDSSITSDLIVNGGIKFSEIRSDSDDIYFLEGRPEEAGRYVIMKKTLDGKQKFFKNRGRSLSKKCKVPEPLHTREGKGIRPLNFGFTFQKQNLSIETKQLNLEV